MTAKSQPLSRRAALALLPALAACGSTADAPLSAPPRGRVLVLRGLLNLFSTGMNVLTDMLRDAGYDATVHNHTAWRGLADRTADQAKAGALPRPLVVVGHSFGADDAILLAGRLGAAGVAVDLLVTYDPAWMLNVPRGPVRVLNFHQDRDTFERRLSPGPGFDGRIENRQVTDESHLSIDKNLGLHRQTLAALAELSAMPARGAAASIAPRTIAAAAPAPAARGGTAPRRASLPLPPAPPVRAAR